MTLSSKKRDNITPMNVDYTSIKKAALILRAINHKLRQQILELLHHEEKITVTELYVKLRLEQSVASQHLAILRRAGIVKTTREGKFIWYSIDYNKVADIERYTKDLLG
jgi:DNA-binding transcriptional ArsR family regulator